MKPKRRPALIREVEAFLRHRDPESAWVVRVAVDLMTRRELARGRKGGAAENLAALFDEHLSQFSPGEQKRRVANALRVGRGRKEKRV